MKKLMLGLAIILSTYSTTSFAALPGPIETSSTMGNGSFTMGITSLYWKPTTNNLDYAETYAVDSTGAFLTPRIFNWQDVDFRAREGLQASIGYIFPYTRRDITLSYTHWDHSEQASLNGSGLGISTLLSSVLFAINSNAIVSGTANVSSPGSPSIPANFTATAATGVGYGPLNIGSNTITNLIASSTFKNQTWDLNFGQVVNTNGDFHLHWFGGLRYSRLEHKFNVGLNFAPDSNPFDLTAPSTVVLTYPTPPTTDTGSGTFLFVNDATTPLYAMIDESTKFEGVGPRLGLNSIYHLGYGFGIIGDIAASLLSGKIDSGSFAHVSGAGILVAPTAVSNVTIDSIDNGPDAGDTATITSITQTTNTPYVFDNSNDQTLRHPSQRRVVPNIDIKLGVDYIYQFHNRSHSTMKIDAGYMLSYYLNAIDRINSLDTGSFDNRQFMSLSFEGPYVGVQVNL